MMSPYRTAALASLMSLLSVSQAQTPPQLLRDLDGQRVTLTKEELQQLMPNATISRVASTGNTHRWRNDADGTFIASSDGAGPNRKAGTSPGKWHISDDGRYCVLIEWKATATEEWCRFIIRSGNAYYMGRSDKSETERVFALGISK